MVILNREKLEYQESNKLFQYWNTVSWTVSSLLLIGAFTILGLSFRVANLGFLIGLACASWGLLVLSFGIYLRLKEFTDILLRKLKELERQTFLDVHLKIEKEDRKNGFGHLILFLGAFDVLFLAWAARFLFF
ncbi:MAG: hypothetical protein U9O89_03800 [Thermoproteota archaeon]|nr:hypothetical protein [Thermoproteota archaeon]